MIKIKFFIVCVLLPAFCYAKSRNLEEVKIKYGIVEGKYKFSSGKKDLCVEGDYKLQKRGDTIVLLADSHVLASSLEKEVETVNEKPCSLGFTTAKIRNGFSAVETQHCPKANVSSIRRFSIEFSKTGLVYKISSENIFDKSKHEHQCQMTLDDPEVVEK